MTTDLCHICRHPWDEHDGMGDCGHLDARTRTGLCTKHDHAPLAKDGTPR